MITGERYEVTLALDQIVWAYLQTSCLGMVTFLKNWLNSEHRNFTGAFFVTSHKI